MLILQTSGVVSFLGKLLGAIFVLQHKKLRNCCCGGSVFFGCTLAPVLSSSLAPLVSLDLAKKDNLFVKNDG